MTTTEKGVMVPLWAMTDCGGDARDAVLWAQITWWFQPGQRDGQPRTTHLVERFGEVWMRTTDAEMSEETGMSSDQVYRARRALTKRGLLASKSTVIKGQKVTLVRPTVDREPVDNEGVEDEQIANPRDHSADSRKQETADSRKLPIKNHDRSEEERARAESARRFDEHFWPAYPARNGRKLEKAEALTVWLRLSIDDQRAALRGARHYAASGELPKNAHRWLRDRCWDDWQDPPTPSFANSSRGRLTREQRQNSAGRNLWLKFDQEEATT